MYYINYDRFINNIKRLAVALISESLNALSHF